MSLMVDIRRPLELVQILPPITEKKDCWRVSILHNRGETDFESVNHLASTT